MEWEVEMIELGETGGVEWTVVQMKCCFSLISNIAILQWTSSIFNFQDYLDHKEYFY